MRHLYYDLDGNPTDVATAELLLRDPNRRIGYDTITLVGGDTMAVSTVFLVIDHNFGDHPTPVLWETMAFIEETGQYHEEFCQRYTSREQALQGHRDTVELCRSLAPIQEGR